MLKENVLYAPKMFVCSNQIIDRKVNCGIDYLGI